MVVMVLAGEGTLGTFFAGDFVLLWRELLFPLRLCFRDAVACRLLLLCLRIATGREEEKRANNIDDRSHNDFVRNLHLVIHSLLCIRFIQYALL